MNPVNLTSFFYLFLIIFSASDYILNRIKAKKIVRLFISLLINILPLYIINFRGFLPSADFDYIPETYFLVNVMYTIFVVILISYQNKLKNRMAYLNILMMLIFLLLGSVNLIYIYASIELIEFFVSMILHKEKPNKTRGHLIKQIIMQKIQLSSIFIIGVVLFYISTGSVNILDIDVLDYSTFQISLGFLLTYALLKMLSSSRLQNLALSSGRGFGITLFFRSIFKSSVVISLTRLVAELLPECPPEYQESLIFLLSYGVAAWLLLYSLKTARESSPGKLLYMFEVIFVGSIIISTIFYLDDISSLKIKAAILTFFLAQSGIFILLNKNEDQFNVKLDRRIFLVPFAFYVFILCLPSVTLIPYVFNMNVGLLLNEKNIFVLAMIGISMFIYFSKIMELFLQCFNITFTQSLTTPFRLKSDYIHIFICVILLIINIFMMNIE
jgi:hypothetical protein